MPTQYPGNIDNFTNPLPTDKLNNPTHAGQHTNSNDAIEAIETYVGVANSTDPNSLTNRVEVLEQGGGGSGTVTSVGATAPVTSTGGTAPVIGMPVATTTVNGYLSAANWNTFNNKQNPATSLAGYGITNAYTKTESDSFYPTKAGAGASGTWSINITGNANYASTSDIANWAKSVEDLNNPAADIKQWTGTQSQYDALGTWDPYTFYTITDAAGAGGGYLPLSGGTMTGAIDWNENSQSAKIDIIADPLSSTGDVFTIDSDAGVQVKGPYVVLDTTNLQITMPGAQQNAAITVAGIDSFGVVSLGYTALPPPAYSITDTTATPVVIKATGTIPPTAWVSLGLSVTLGQDVAAGTGNVSFEGIFENITPRTGTLEFGLRVNSGAINARDVVVQISANFYQTIAMQLPMINSYLDGDVLELMARVTTNSNDQFSLTMANSSTDLGAMRVYTTGAGSGSGSGAVNSVGGVAPIVSSGGTDPQISMPAATASANGYLSAANFTTFSNKVDNVTASAPVTAFESPAGTINISMPVASGSASGYLSSANWNTFNSKANAATTIAGYGITDAYTKTEVDNSLATKQPLDADLTAIAGLAGTSGFLKKTSTDTWTLDTSSYSLVGHTHVIADVTGLQTALNGKATASTTLAGYGITDAYTKTQSDTNYPTKAGSGATGTWGIGITGTAAIATVVNDNGAGATLKLWYGTEAEYTAIGTKDPTTLYFRSA